MQQAVMSVFVLISQAHSWLERQVGGEIITIFKETERCAKLYRKKINRRNTILNVRLEEWEE